MREAEGGAAGGGGGAAGGMLINSSFCSVLYEVQKQLRGTRAESYLVLEWSRG